MMSRVSTLLFAVALCAAVVYADNAAPEINPEAILNLAKANGFDPSSVMDKFGVDQNMLSAMGVDNPTESLLKSGVFESIMKALKQYNTEDLMALGMKIMGNMNNPHGIPEILKDIASFFGHHDETMIGKIVGNLDMDKITHLTSTENPKDFLDAFLKHFGEHLSHNANALVDKVAVVANHVHELSEGRGDLANDIQSTLLNFIARSKNKDAINELLRPERLEQLKTTVMAAVLRNPTDAMGIVQGLTEEMGGQAVNFVQELFGDLEILGKVQEWSEKLDINGITEHVERVRDEL